MDTKLVKIGDEWVVIIDPSLLDATKITPETSLSVTTDGKSIFVAPENIDRRKRFERAMQDTLEEYDEVFERLAEE